jgi:hypothetical protein
LHRTHIAGKALGAGAASKNNPAASGVSKAGFFSNRSQAGTPSHNRLHQILGDNTRTLDARLKSVRKLNREHVKRMALTVNSEGQLPIEILDDTDKSQTNIKLHATLFNHMRSYEMKPLSEQVSLDDVMRLYYSAVNRQLNYNLKLACDVANVTRGIIKDSDTHTQSNSYASEARSKLGTTIKHMRRKIASESKGKTHFEYLEITVKYTQLYGVGNCGEFGLVALYETIKRDISVSAEVFSIENGDHVFLVIGRDPDSDPHDYTTWGENAVICDAWSGEVYPASRLADILKDHATRKIGHGEEINITPHFNPDYHLLAQDFILSDFEKEANLRKLKAFNLFGRSRARMKQPSVEAAERMIKGENPILYSLAIK